MALTMEPTPFGMPSRKFAMWLFIIADAATFAAILFAYGYVRLSSPNWTRPFDFYPTIANGLLMTFVLLTSSFTMIGATVAARDGKQPQALRWLGATILLGLVFAALHVGEWVTMFKEGWSTATNPLGGSTLVGGSFFIITGLSLVHVIAGVVALIVIAPGYRRGRWDASYIETTGLYWQFVDVVWMFVFPLVYLLNAK
jgi:cytochrome c oxidase subunit 3